MYDRILVPTDGSDGAEAAFEHALGLAVSTGAELHVVHAVDPTLVPVEVSADGVFEALRAAGEGLVSELRERGEAEGVAVETAVLTGPAYQAITEYAEEHDVDLLVMGTHGRTGLNRWLLGSVTERVVRTAPVPVLTVRADTD
ncbi:MAG: universal stress protein [Halobacteriales archaeon]|nr:universal stress protein [Halobacteriales archaeon]